MAFFHDMYTNQRYVERRLIMEKLVYDISVLTPKSLDY